MKYIEDLNSLNRKIVDIIIDDNSVGITRYDGSFESLQIPDHSPSLLEENESSVNFIKNKPKVYSVDSVDNVDSPIKFDKCELDDGSVFLYTGSNWRMIQRPTHDIGQSIRIPSFNKDIVYNSGRVVYHNGIMYRSLETNSISPSSYGSPWSIVTEYDLFVSLCELTSPSLYGYFDVADSMAWVTREETIDNLGDFVNWFNSGDSSNILEGTSGIWLDVKHPIDNSVVLTRNFDENIIITELEVSGVAVGTTGTIGGFSIEFGDNSFELDRWNKDNERCSIAANGDYVQGTQYDGEEFLRIMKLDNSEEIDSMSFSFNYDKAVPLSKHIIGTIRIKYKAYE